MEFEGFESHFVDADDARLFVRTGGNGPPLLLLHGYPQTHMIWHAVAQRLARRFSLVIPDLRGYGRSSGPRPDPEGTNYSKRAMAADVIALMSHFGHRRFSVAGHDRGGRVAYRLALDHPKSVERLGVLDIVPTLDMWARMSHSGALRSYHWSFLAQPAPMPEHMIGLDPDFYLMHLLRRWAGDFSALQPAALADYQQAFRRPSVIAATCADYRAGANIDVAHDRADRDAGRLIECPVLVIWGRQYLTTQSPLATWQTWATNVHDVPLDCGHFIAEEQPDACAAALAGFFAGE